MIVSTPGGASCRATSGGSVRPRAAAVTAQSENPLAIDRSRPPIRMTNVIATAMMPAGAHWATRLKMFVLVAKAGLAAETAATRMTKASSTP